MVGDNAVDLDDDDDDFGDFEDVTPTTETKADDFTKFSGPVLTKATTKEEILKVFMSTNSYLYGC